METASPALEAANLVIEIEKTDLEIEQNKSHLKYVEVQRDTEFLIRHRARLSARLTELRSQGVKFTERKANP